MSMTWGQMGSSWATWGDGKNGLTLELEKFHTGSEGAILGKGVNDHSPRCWTNKLVIALRGIMNDADFVDDRTGHCHLDS